MDANRGREPTSRHHEVIVIGGGQTGLAVGYELMRNGVDVVVLDANTRVGDAWRHRWDSLRLFTPARMNGLPGMPFPAGRNEFVSKDEVADFLQHYADAMEIPIASNTRVERLWHDAPNYVATTANGEVRAGAVVVAMAGYQKPRIPPFAKQLDPRIVQLHSSAYRNPSQLSDGSVLIVGAGNSGADIGVEVARTHRTTMAGDHPGHIPFRLESWFGRNVGTRIVRFLLVHVLNTSTPVGRRARPKMLDGSGPLVRVRPRDLKRARVERIGRIAAVEGGLPVTADSHVVDADNVIWCTGFHAGFDWIDLPVLDERGRPTHHRGIVADWPGLYFVGLHFLHSVWSSTFTGMVPDADHVVQHLVSRRPRLAAPVQPRPGPIANSSVGGLVRPGGPGRPGSEPGRRGRS